QLRRAQLSEFLAIGALASGTAALTASALAAVIAERVFDLPWSINWPVALIGAGGGLLLITLTGLLASRRVLAAHQW
ncbi:MAG: FtsX-like permease family protein, partial [Steroidobacteraceae bacterium]